MQGETKCVMEQNPTRRIAVALGSNQGAREDHLSYAVQRLRSLLLDVVVSRFIETEPVDMGSQRMFLNAAAVGLSAAQPVDLLTNLLSIEQERGRDRPFHRAPRTLDLDLILVGDLIVSNLEIELPHPRFRERAFVLRPLAEIAPNMVDPMTGLTIRELLLKVAET